MIDKKLQYYRHIQLSLDRFSLGNHAAQSVKTYPGPCICIKSGEEMAHSIHFIFGNVTG